MDTLPQTFVVGLASGDKYAHGLEGGRVAIAARRKDGRYTLGIYNRDGKLLHGAKRLFADAVQLEAAMLKIAGVGQWVAV